LLSFNFSKSLHKFNYLLTEEGNGTSDHPWQQHNSGKTSGQIAGGGTPQGVHQTLER
jgi:hypothetical protein